MMQESSVNIINGKKQYVMFDLQRLHPDIWYWENVISSPNEFIEFVNNLDADPRSHNAIPSWLPWTASDDKKVVYGAVKTINKYHKRWRIKPHQPNFDYLRGIENINHEKSCSFPGEQEIIEHSK